MRRSKYPSLGILSAFERWVSGGASDERYISEDDFYPEVQKTYDGITSRIYSQRLFHLEKKQFIWRNHQGHLRISALGRKTLLIASVDDITFHNKNVDGYKRLIIFDIPERQRSARDILRRKLKEFECVVIQRSVYLTPYQCEKEIEEVARILHVDRHVSIFKLAKKEK